MQGLIPYVVAPQKNFVLPDWLPFAGGDSFPIQVFGLLVAVGVLLGINRAVDLYAKAKDLDEYIAIDQIRWVLVFGFIISHEVSVLFYFPERVREDPTVLLMLWSGLSSVGGFFGAGIGMVWFLKRRKQPILPYADMNIFGLLLGMCFGRLACSLVHDHPGRIVTEETFMAVGPWQGCACTAAEAAGKSEWFLRGRGSGIHPDCCAVGEGVFRYDLGLMEFLAVGALTLFVYFVYDWRKALPGRLTGLVAATYGFARFWFDFLRETEVTPGVSMPDVRYAGLTTAQYFSLAFVGAGLYLLFIRKPKPSDLDWAKDSERIAQENARAEDDKAKDDPGEPTSSETASSETASSGPSSDP